MAEEQADYTSFDGQNGEGFEQTEGYENFGEQQQTTEEPMEGEQKPAAEGETGAAGEGTPAVEEDDDDR